MILNYKNIEALQFFFAFLTLIKDFLNSILLEELFLFSFL